MGTNKKSNKGQTGKLKGRKAKEFPRVAEALEKPLGETAAPNAAGAVAKSKTSKRKSKPDKPKKVSALDAAAKVLAETGGAMNCQEMISAMAEKGYWKSANGQTPAATLYSAILRELAKPNKSRFVKTERGKFSLAGAK